jgi:hypothetical protein
MELPLEPCHLGVPSGASKMISKPMVHLAQTMHLSCTYLTWPTSPRSSFGCVQNDFQSCGMFATNGPNRASTWVLSPKCSIKYVQNYFCAYGTFSTNHAHILRQDYHNLQMDRNEHPLDPCHLGVPSGACKMISELMVHLAQTVHLSCTDTNTISKRTKTRFHMTNIT